MFLYKFIGFNKNYWSAPLTEEKLHFASMEDLRKQNDNSELTHEWGTSSTVFSTFGHHLRDAYDKLFSSARVLCLGKRLNKYCWFAFCESGQGICYEFKFSLNQKKSDITSDSISYSPSKNINFPNFALKNVVDPGLRKILEKKTSLSTAETIKVKNWFDSDEARAISRKHVVHEIRECRKFCVNRRVFI